jgi:hypothetical protein
MSTLVIRYQRIGALIETVWLRAFYIGSIGTGPEKQDDAKFGMLIPK